MNDEIMAVSNPKSRGDQMQNWLSWKTWNTTTNEHSAVIAMQFLKEICNAYQSELIKAKEEYDLNKRTLSSKNQTNLTAINNKEKSKEAELKEEYERLKLECERKKLESYTEYGKDLNELLSSVKSSGKVRHFLEKLISSTTAPLETKKKVALAKSETARTQLENAFNAYLKQLEILYNAQLNELNNATKSEKSNESSGFNSEELKLQEVYKHKLSEIENRFKSIINEVMSSSAINEYAKVVISSIPSFENYTCSNGIPECVYFGDVTMELTHKANVQPEVSQLITYEAGNAIDKTAVGTLTAKMPYCQRLDDGISLFLNYSPNERKMYQEHLKMMLLKLFMAFPAGKLEATMIDPLELGETFAMFTKLGEEQSRIIDTKVWSQEKDISEAINILRQKLETMTQSYGTDKATRLKKEPIRVLAITDFPIGFSQNALQDLQAIVRKSASYGVCVFIWANSEEIEKLQSSQQSVFNEIKQMLHVATANGDSLKLETAKYGNVFLKLDPMAKAKDFAPHIINELTKGIHTSTRKIERFVDMYDGIEDPNNWFAENTINELAIPIGIKGANTIVKMIVGKTDGSTSHHALIAGQTGAGKSTLLHTIIMSTLLNYSPEEAQLYLVDFKEGVEFKTYSKLNLPSIRVVAIDCEREFGLNILKELEKEMKRRYDLFKREADREEISDYRRITGKKIPKILVVFDEVQELFRGASGDSISKECENILGELLTLGRAAGIHIILASQNFNLISSIKPTLFAHAAIRIAIKGSEDSANSVLGDSNPGAKQLQDGATGAAVYNDASGKESANSIFQVGYLEKEKRADFLKTLSALQNSEAYPRKNNEKTRILLTNAEDDIFNVFNQLILNRQVSVLDEDETRYCLTIGDGFDMNRKFKIGMAPVTRQNLLMIGGDEKRAASIFYFSILSLLYGELGVKDVRKDNQLIHLVDLSVEDEYYEASNTSFKHLESLFPQQIKRVGMREMVDLINNTYDTLTRRLDGDESSEERLFLMFFGINRAHKLTGTGMYEDGDVNDEKSSLAKLDEIFKYGPKLGINSLIWGENLSSISKMMSTNINRDFAQRIVFSTDSDTMEQIVMETDAQSLRPTTAVYMNVDDDVKNTHFRPYEIPAKVWVEKIAKVYREFE